MIKAHSLFRRIWQKLGMSETVLPPVLVWLRLLLVQWPGHAMLRASDGCHLRLYDCAGLWARIRRLWGLKRLRTAGRTAIRAGWATGFSRATEICFCTFVQLQSPIFLRVVLTTMTCLAEVSNRDSEEQDVDGFLFQSYLQSLLV